MPRRAGASVFKFEGPDRWCFFMRRPAHPLVIATFVLAFAALLGGGCDRASPDEAEGTAAGDEPSSADDGSGDEAGVGNDEGSGSEAETLAGDSAGSGAGADDPDASAPTEARPGLDTADGGLSRGMPDLSLTGQAVASQRAEAMHAGCMGSVPFEPPHVLQVTEPMRVVLDVTRASHEDLVLVARDASGAWHCDDDSGAALLPRIDASVPAGPLEVWVGTYEHGVTTSWTLRVGEGAAPLSLAACDASQTIRIGDGFERATASGSTTAERTCTAALGAAGCVGAFGATGGPCIEVETATRVSVRAVSDRFDPVLALQTSDPLQTRINDDEGAVSLHARITTTLAPGRYAAHIGAWELRAGGEWRLLVERAPEPVALPAPSGCVRLTPGVPVELSGDTGVIVDCHDRLGVPCVGWMPSSENLCLQVSEPMHVAATVTDADFDATAAITGPGVARFADDGGGFPLPSVTATLPPGQYSVLIGARERRVGGAWRMVIDPFAWVP